MQNEEKKNFSWKLVDSFTDEETGMTVRISASDHTPRSRFSIQIGRNVPDRDGSERERFLNFIPCFVACERYKVVSVNVSPSTLSELVSRALSKIAELAQIQENRCLEEKINREKRGEYREPPKTGLKTLAKRDKERRERAGEG